MIPAAILGQMERRQGRRTGGEGNLSSQEVKPGINSSASTRLKKIFLNMSKKIGNTPRFYKAYDMVWAQDKQKEQVFLNVQF